MKKKRAQPRITAQAPVVEAPVVEAPAAQVAAPRAASPATGTGTSTGTTSLTVSTVTGTISMGAMVTGTGVPNATVITGQTSGTTGGAGVYTTNVPTTLSSIALTFTPAAPWPRTYMAGRWVQRSGDIYTPSYTYNGAVPLAERLKWLNRWQRRSPPATE